MRVLDEFEKVQFLCFNEKLAAGYQSYRWHPGVRAFCSRFQLILSCIVTEAATRAKFCTKIDAQTDAVGFQRKECLLLVKASAVIVPFRHARLRMLFADEPLYLTCIVQLVMCLFRRHGAI
jgi:hypothetical protein